MKSTAQCPRLFAPAKQAGTDPELDQPSSFQWSSPLFVHSSQTLQDCIRQQEVELDRRRDQIENLEEHLEQARHELNDLYDSLPIPCVDIDSAGFIRQVNRAGTEFLGQPPGRLAGRSFLCWVYPADLHRFAVHLRESLRTGRQGPVEFRLRRPGAGTVTVEIMSASVPQLNRSMSISRLVIVNVSDHVRTEEVFRKQISRMASSSTQCRNSAPFDINLCPEMPRADARPDPSGICTVDTAVSADPSNGMVQAQARGTPQGTNSNGAAHPKPSPAPVIRQQSTCP